VNRPEKNRLEWAVFAVGLVLVLATLGYLVREVATGREGPPEIVVEFGQPRAAPSGYLVPVRVRNVGPATAEDVVVSVVLNLPDGSREEGELNLAFLPRDSRREGGLHFNRDPGQGKLVVGTIAFEIP
jgi:uncharacterized protein (TIGR02588 family)